MGSGKTTVGKKVAKLLGVRFADGDVELEARTGRSVADWFSEGEDAFREAEASVLAGLLGDEQPIVIGAGGGVVVTEANRQRLRGDDVTVVYLHGEPAFLASRAEAKPHRPLLADQDPRVVFDQMYRDRDDLYRSVADAVVEIRPAHEAGVKPKWRIAETVVETLADLGRIAPLPVEDVPTEAQA